MSPRTSLFLPGRLVPGIDKMETEEFLIPSGALKVWTEGYGHWLLHEVPKKYRVEELEGEDPAQLSGEREQFMPACQQVHPKHCFLVKEKPSQSPCL